MVRSSRGCDPPWQGMALGMGGGWSHCINNQEIESRQEVGPHYKHQTISLVTYFPTTSLHHHFNLPCFKIQIHQLGVKGWNKKLLWGHLMFSLALVGGWDAPRESRMSHDKVMGNTEAPLRKNVQAALPWRHAILETRMWFPGTAVLPSVKTEVQSSMISSHLVLVKLLLSKI